MEKIKADVSANYDDRDITGDSIDVNFSSDGEMNNNIWFNISISNKREDDYITVAMKIEDILEAIGKAVSNEKEE